MGLTYSSDKGRYEDDFGEARPREIEEALRRHKPEQEIPADRDPSIDEFL